MDVIKGGNHCIMDVIEGGNHCIMDVKYDTSDHFCC